MDKYYRGETRDHDYESRLRSAGRSVLHTTLSVMLAASLVPADAVRVIAQELDGDDSPALVNESVEGEGSGAEGQSTPEPEGTTGEGQATEGEGQDSEATNEGGQTEQTPSNEQTEQPAEGGTDNTLSASDIVPETPAPTNDAQGQKDTGSATTGDKGTKTSTTTSTGSKGTTTSTGTKGTKATAVLGAKNGTDGTDGDGQPEEAPKADENAQVTYVGVESDETDETLNLTNENAKDPTKLTKLVVRADGVVDGNTDVSYVKVKIVPHDTSKPEVEKVLAFEGGEVVYGLEPGAVTVTAAPNTAKGDATVTRTFVVDTQAPKAALAFSAEDKEQGEHGGKKVYAERSFTVTVEDEREIDKKSLSVVAMVSGEEKALKPEADWTIEKGENGKSVATASFKATANGLYESIVVKSSDKVNPVETSFANDSFYVDTEDPKELSIKVANGELVDNVVLYGDEAAISVSDLTFDPEASTIKVTHEGEELTTDGWKADGTATVKLDKDGAYTIEATAVDAVGKSATKTVNFTVDNTAPEVVDDKVTFANTTLVEGACLKVQDVENDPTVSFEVAEAQLVATDSKAVLKGPDGATIAETTIDTSGEVKLVPDVTKLGAGTYTLDVVLKDAAGQQGGLSRTFTIDSEQPKLNVKLDGEKLDDNESDITYYRGVDTLTATITVTEDNFDPNLVVVKRGGEQVAGSWTTEGNVHTMTVTFEQGNAADSAYTLTVAGSDKGADLAGYDFVLVDDKGAEITGEDGTPLSAFDSGKFVVDNEAPTIDIVDIDKFPMNADGTGLPAEGEEGHVPEEGVDFFERTGKLPGERPEGTYFNRGAGYRITVTDPNIDLSGIKVGRVNEEGTFEGESIAESDWTFDEKTGVATTVVSTTEDNDYERPSVLATDKAGNSNVDDLTKERLFVVDTTNPEIKVTGNDNLKIFYGADAENDEAVNNEVYYTNAGFSVTLEYGEKNYLKDEVSTGATEATVGELTPSVENAAEARTRTVEIANEGTYQLDVTLEDLAGRSAHAKSQPIVFDLTAPELNVEFGDEVQGAYNEVVNGEMAEVSYYDHARTATITVTEDNFDSASINIETNGTVGEWQPADGSGSTHTLTVTFTDDNIRGKDDSVNPYYLKVTGSDRAGNLTEFKDDEGNVLNAFDSGYFCVDTKMPEIEFVQLPETFVYGTDEKGNELTPVEGTDYFERSATDVTQHEQTDRPEGNYFNIETGAVIHVYDENLDLEKTTVNGKVAQWDLKWDEEKQTYYYATFAYAEGDHKAPVVHAVDKAAHEADKGEDRDFVVDRTDPKIFDFVWNTTTPQRTYHETVGSEQEAVDVHYYNEPRNVSFAVLEHNWYDYNVNTLDLEGKAEVGALTKPAEVTNGLMDLLPEGTIPEDLASQLKDLRTQTVDFTADGPYRLSVATTDLAGRSASATSETFVVDQHAPILTVTYDNNDAHLGKYYKAQRTATIVVDEHNFDPELFTITVEKRIREDGDPDPKFIFTYDPAQWVPNGDFHTYTVSFPSDGWYELKVNGTDKASNPVEKAFEDAFVIDMTAPVVTNNYESYKNELKEKGKNPGSFEGIDYFDDTVTITTTITDLYLDESRTTIVDPEGKELAFKAAEWEKKRNNDGSYTYTKTWTYNEGGPYGSGSNTMRKTPEVHTADFADNTFSLDPVPFVVDLTEPSVTLAEVNHAPSAVGKDILEGNKESDPYQFFNQATEIRFEVSDAHLIKEVRVEDPDGAYVKSPESTGIKTGSPEGVLVVELKDGTPNSNDAVFERNRDNYRAKKSDREVYLQVTDIAGNSYCWTIDDTGKVTSVRRKSKSNLSLNNEGVYPIALIQDGTAPRIDLSGATAGTYYNAPQTVHEHINEYYFDFLQRFDPKRVVLNWTYRPNVAGAGTSTNDVTADQLEGSVPDYTYSHKCTADGHYTFYAQFMDYAQNLSNRVEIGEFTIDTVAPLITVTFDNNNVRNGKYYDAVRTATIHVTEHNFDPSLIRIDTDGSIGGWRSEGDDHYIDVYFGEGNDHRLAVEGADLAGNAAARYEEPAFNIDLTNPTIKISGEVQRSGVDKPHTNAQGQTEYTFDDEYKGDINDDVLPANSTETLEDHHAYNGMVKPFVDFSDLSNGVHNFDSTAVTLTLESKRNPNATSYIPPEVIKSDGSGATFSFEDIGLITFGSDSDSIYDPAADDIYTLTAHMTDLAGREADATMTFSVNRYGSTYYIEEIDESKQDTENGFALGYVADAPELVVHEVNVSGAEAQDDHVVQMTYNQAPSMLAEKPATAKDGYTVAALSNVQSKAVRDYGWSEYVYTIREGNFGQGSEVDKGDGAQGNYRVEVIGYDRASNDVSTSRYLSDPEAFGKQVTKTAPDQQTGRTSIANAISAEEARKAVEGAKTSAAVSFTLDQVAPAIEDVRIPNPLAVGSTYKASFFVSDDWTQGDSVVVRVDGKEVEDLVNDENRADGTGSYSFDITSSAMPFTFHTVEIEVEDGVHDKVSYATKRFIVTTLIPELAVLGLGTAGVVGGTVFYRRRKNTAEPDVPTKHNK